MELGREPLGAVRAHKGLVQVKNNLHSQQSKQGQPSCRATRVLREVSLEDCSTEQGARRAERHSSQKLRLSIGRFARKEAVLEQTPQYSSEGGPESADRKQAKGPGLAHSESLVIHVMSGRKKGPLGFHGTLNARREQLFHVPSPIVGLRHECAETDGTEGCADTGDSGAEEHADEEEHQQAQGVYNEVSKGDEHGQDGGRALLG